MFAKAFVINLPFKKDRLEQFQKSVPTCFGAVDVWPAVHGDSIRHPDWWNSGAGAWGCYRSHLQILEHCYQNRVESYVVFEDDAIFREDATELFQQFAKEVPHDWEMLYLGGQLLHEKQHPPKRLSDNVMIPYNVNRTHCFAVHQRGYEKLYKHLNATPFVKNEHIDHHLGRLHESGRIKIFCPSKWIVGQDGGPSNISGKVNAAQFWIDPERYSSDDKSWQSKKVPAVFLQCPHNVALELEVDGWHRGHWMNADRLDNGVCQAIVSLDIKAGLTGWYKAVMPEAVREDKKCVCLYHPSLTLEVVQSLTCAKFHVIKAVDAADANRQLSDIVGSIESTEYPSARTRNLIYHIWPKKGNGVWRWNVSQLLNRIDQFDGVRSIGIVTDANSDGPEEVKAAFNGVRVDNWIIENNDPERGETVTFKRLLDTLPNDNSITFYGHAKGVRHDNNENIRTWSSIMYEVCLDNPRFVSASLDQYPIAGPFKNTREYAGQMKHGWHYSGTFFWFKNSELFNREWQSVPEDYYGTEKYLGNLFTHAEAGCLFGDHVGWLYHVHEMARVGNMLAAWRKLAKPIDKSEIIPVYINARNLLTPLKKMVEYLLQIPNARPIIVDNDSTWQPLLDYYESCPVKVIRTGRNGGKFGWASHILDHAAEGIEKYVVTDSDLELDGIPLDVLNVLSNGLDANPGVTKVGLSLDFEEIPDEYPFKKEVIEHECQHWRHRTSGFCHAGIDTTFSMRRASDPIAYETWGHRRADRPYCAKHWPWHWTPELIESSEEIRHYISTCETAGNHWSERHKELIAK